MSTTALVQLFVFFGLNAIVGIVTWWHCRKADRSGNDAKEYFLAGNSLNWIFIAGSLTLTNISTDTLVGWNGNQMMLVVCWELAGVPGLILLAKIFVPLYYKYKCTTVTELLERRYQNMHIRATVGSIFLLGDVFIFLPAMLYTSSLLLKSMFGLQLPLVAIASCTALVGATYAIGGGLRAVAISDTYSGVIVLGMSLLVAILSMNAVNWDLSTLPPERMTLIGGHDSVLPWPTLLTGMVFTQLYYWSTNQTITQRILAAPNIREAQKGAYGAAVIRLLIVPPMVILPGLAAYKLFGPLGDKTYGTIVAHVLPTWLLGAFAAAMFAAVMTSYNATLNSAASLYICDLHQKFIDNKKPIKWLSIWLQVGFAIFSVVMVPVYANAESIIQTIQKLLGLFSMPILAAFITGLLFRNVDARAVIATLVFGAIFYALLSFGWPAWHHANPAIPDAPHFLHLMFATVWTCVGFALALNRVAFGRRAEFELGTRQAWREAFAVLRG
ncbi:MAG TPA: SLC5 family protein [Lacunisphaera sp.]|nr:SLC5 family protein [Lacunisphaera sp.]